MSSLSNKYQVENKKETTVLIKMRQLILGDEIADLFTQVTFYINLVFWILFMVWSVASLIAFSQIELIISAKEIPVEEIIDQRGIQLGFEPGRFIDSLMFYQYIRLFTWITFLFGLILLYRKMKSFIYFTLIPLIVNVIAVLFLLGYEYFKSDISTFDKISLLIMAVSCVVFYFLIRKEDDEGVMNFFGVEDTDE